VDINAIISNKIRSGKIAGSLTRNNNLAYGLNVEIDNPGTEAWWLDAARNPR